MRILCLIVVALGAVLVLDATVASSQGIPTPTIQTERPEIEACIADARADGAPVGAATRSCIPDPESFTVCMGEARSGDESQAEALDRCLEEQLEGSSTEEGSSTSEDRTLPTMPAPSDPLDTTPEAPNLDIPVPEKSVPATSSSDGLGMVPVAAIALVAAALGALAGVAFGRRSSAPAVAPAVFVPPLDPAAAANPPAPSGFDPGDLARERSLLIQTMVEVADQVTSAAIRGQLVERLTSVGVQPINVAAGTTFDPANHRGVQAEPTTSAEQAGTVVDTDREGWSDRGQVLRHPDVIVYRQEEP